MQTNKFFAGFTALALCIGSLAQEPIQGASNSTVPASASSPPPGMPNLARARPIIFEYPADEIDRVASKTGLTDCFWTGLISKDTFNILIPDIGAMYWLSQFQLPEGAKLLLEGQYPHGRYLSFNSYNPIGQPVDVLNDQTIVPMAGSSNPFLPGAKRDVNSRHFTITVEPGSVQAGVSVDNATRPTNTLYIPVADKLAQVWMRIYVPDHGQDAKGGVPLPKPVLVLADGSRVSGDALCKQIVVKNGSVKDYRATPDGVRHMYAVPGARSPYHPAHPAPLNWGAFYNPLWSITAPLTNTPYEGMRAGLDKRRTAGFFSTLDNRYMTSFVDNRYGDVLTITGKAPRTPLTQRGATVMESEVDMRYWSLCTYRSIADGAVDECLYDEQVPKSSKSRYTIVISPPEKRPSNARADCGVAWLPWGAGDGAGNPHGGFLAFRHMLPSPSFKNSLWATQVPGDERQALGDYYPDSVYESKAAFEAKGCPVK